MNFTWCNLDLGEAQIKLVAVNCRSSCKADKSNTVIVRSGPDRSNSVSLSDNRLGVL